MYYWYFEKQNSKTFHFIVVTLFLIDWLSVVTTAKTVLVSFTHPTFSSGSSFNRIGECWASGFQQKCLPLGDQAFRTEIPSLVQFFIIISKFGLHSVRSKKDSSFRWAIDLVTKDSFFHLQEEQLLGDVLDQLFKHILRKKLGPEFELERVLFPDFLSRDLNSDKVSVNY